MKCGLILIVFAPILALAQAAADLSSSEGKILALENAWGQAEKAGDSKALQSLLDDSLVYIRYDGSLWSKTQYLASLNDTSSRVEQAVNENMAAHGFRRCCHRHRNLSRQRSGKRKPLFAQRTFH